MQRENMSRISIAATTDRRNPLTRQRNPMTCSETAIITGLPQLWAWRLKREMDIRVYDLTTSDLSHQPCLNFYVVGFPFQSLCGRTQIPIHELRETFCTVPAVIDVLTSIGAFIARDFKHEAETREVAETSFCILKGRIGMHRLMANGSEFTQMYDSEVQSCVEKRMELYRDGCKSREWDHLCELNDRIQSALNAEVVALAAQLKSEGFY